MDKDESTCSISFDDIFRDTGVGCYQGRGNRRCSDRSISIGDVFVTKTCTWNQMLSDSQSAPEDNISALALIEREADEGRGQLGQSALQTSTSSLKDFVDARIETFSKNVEFAQIQAENLTMDIVSEIMGDKDEFQERGLSSVTEFVNARVNTFSRNLETISMVMIGS